MKIIFADHECHLRTHSADFFLEIIQDGNIVKPIYYKSAYDCKISAADIEWADLIIFWEFLPSRFSIGCVGKPCLFVPMYDNEWGSVFQWRRIALSGMGVLSFCDAISAHAAKCGVKNLLTVHFALDPRNYAGHSGDPAVATLWERGNVSLDTLKRLFPKGALKRTVLIRRNDGGTAPMPIPESDVKDWNIDVHEGGFVPKRESMELTKDCGIYIAPRFAEGIGMSFLEAMAAGKCVVAHNNARMNEYIENGKTGILVDMRNPAPIDIEDVARIQGNMQEAAQCLYSRWLREKDGIPGFLKRIASGRGVKSEISIHGILLFALYLAEGAIMRMKEKFS